MSKRTEISSEIRVFFNENRQKNVMSNFMCLLESFKLTQGILCGIKRYNCKLANLQVFQILVLMLFFAVPELTGINEETMLELIIKDHKRLAAFKNLAELA